MQNSDQSNGKKYRILSYDQLKNTEAQTAFEKLRQAISQKDSFEKVQPLIYNLQEISSRLNLDLLNVWYETNRSPGLIYEETLLYTVARQAQLEIAQALLVAGADPAQGAYTGANALNNITSAYMQDKWNTTTTQKALKELIHSMVEINSNVLQGHYNGRFGIGNTPLHDVIDRKEWDLVKYFIKKGANIDMEDLEGQTARTKLQKNTSCPVAVLALIESHQTSRPK